MQLGRFVSPREAVEILEAARLGRHVGFTEDPETGCWYWEEPDQNGWGPWHSFCVANSGEEPEGFRYIHSCNGARRGCVRPSHIPLLPRGGFPEHPPPPPSARRSFIERIRSERMVRGDRKSLARELGVAQSTLKGWEEGTSHPGADVEERIARKLGWDGEARRWVVTVVHQEPVVAHSAGEAGQMVLDSLTRDGRPSKAVIYSVSEVI